MEGAVGIFRPAAGKVLRVHHAAHLLLDETKHTRYGDGLFRAFKPAAPEVADGLKMHSAYRGHTLKSEAQYIADLRVVHSRRDDRHTHYAKPRRRPVFYLGKLFGQRPPAQCHIDRVVHAVKLQKHRVEPRRLERPGVFRISCKAYAVCVELEKAKALFAPEGYYFRQIVPHARLSARELNIKRTAVRHEIIVLPLDFLHAELALVRARRGKAHGAAEIAARCELQQHTAALTQMLLAESAVVRTAVFRVPAVYRRLHGAAAEVPAHIAYEIVLPDERAEFAVLGALLVHIDIAVCTRALFCGKLSQTHRAHALRPPDAHQISPLSESISMHFS